MNKSGNKLHFHSFYPPKDKSKMVTFMRWLYWQYDKPATIESDKVIFLNKKLELLRQKINLLPKGITYPVVGIGTNPIKNLKKRDINTIRLIYLGVLKQSQGLDLFFDAVGTLKKTFSDITLDIIGSGPDEEYFKIRAQNCAIKVVFHGFVSDENTVDNIISKCNIGLAIYQHVAGNVSYYSDPSKIKRYLSQGLPVITTSVFEFSKEIESTESGVVIDYSPKNLAHAIKKIANDYTEFSINALNLAKKYYYKNTYPALFSNL